MLNLFISYSHQDEELVRAFIRHLAPLKSNGVLKEWYDRKLVPGEKFLDDINNYLDNADIICLMISSHFLASDSCINELKRAIEISNAKGIRVVPIIISPCMWTENKELSSILAIPTDGKPIDSYPKVDEALLETCNWINNLCKSINLIKNLEFKPEFAEFLNSADILSKSHSNKETLNVDDIFVFPKLKCYDDVEVSHPVIAEVFKKKILTYNKLIIAGENQSGKTTFCKVLFKIYLELNYVPVFIEDDDKYLGSPLLKIQNSLKEQYVDLNYDDIEISRIVPIIDNFHFAKHQDKYIEQYSIFEKQVLIVDEIFGLNLKNQNKIKDYSKFKIREYSATERDELIRKWINIKESGSIQSNPNYFQQSIDEKTELIEHSLGVIFGKGIMPSYPFFILSLLAAQDIQKPLDSEITSQGHCYQALIYLYLRKQGVRNDQIDIYTNFLTEVAYYIYSKNGNNLNNDEFLEFQEIYKMKYNLPISITEIIKNLSKVNICKFNGFNQFGFCYNYIYYFFVAKYLSEKLVENKSVINNILSNLHKDENAYITIFIAHHTKSDYVLDELLLNAELLFENFEPATLDKLEMSFFDKNEDKIIKAILPSFDHNVIEERKRLLEEKSKVEEENDDDKSFVNESEEPDYNNKNDIAELFATNLRLSIKTVEVMGLIIKNRSGSLDKNRLEYMFEQGIKVHLRILSSFIELIKDEKAEIEIIDFITERINQVKLEKEDGNKELSIDKIKKLAKSIYWNINFGVLHGFVTKAIHSLGSSNLLLISQAVSDKLNTPSSVIINQGIRMWYGKNLRIEEIESKLKDNSFSITAQNLLKYKIVEHTKMHKLDYKELQKIEQKLRIPISKVQNNQQKN